MQNQREGQSEKLAFEYVLNHKDFVSFLSQTSNFKSRGKTRIVETVLLCLVALLKVVDLINDFSVKGVAFVALIVLVIVLLWAVPERAIRSAARRQADGTVHRLVISREKIVYGYGAGKKELKPGEATVEKLNGMFALGEKGSGMRILLPFRVISDSDMDKVKGILEVYTD